MRRMFAYLRLRRWKRIRVKRWLHELGGYPHRVPLISGLPAPEPDERLKQKQF